MNRLSGTAQRIYAVLRDSGPRDLNVVSGLIGRDAKKADLERVVGELFIAGVVEWQSAKRWRRLAARARA